MNKGNTGPQQNRPSLRGFTLIEISIVFIISGLGMVAAMDLVKQYQASQAVQTNKERIETIKQAINTYVKDNGHLPCAAPRNLPYANPNNGWGTTTTGVPPVHLPSNPCIAAAAPATVSAGTTLSPPPPGTGAVRIGAVPVKDLGLSNTYLADTWGNKFTYAVTEDLTASATYDPTRAAINVLDPVTGNSVMTSPGPAGAMYIVTDPGKDGKGAWSIEGKSKGACGTATSGYDFQNCNDDATFAIAQYSTASSAAHFDDHTVYSTAIDDTVYPICATGQRLTSIDGRTLTCQPVPTIQTCLPGERLTSTDGFNFTCAAIPTIQTCPAGQFSVSTDGFNSICSALPPPPPPPVNPQACAANQRLTSTDGINFTCQNILIPPVCGPNQRLTINAGVLSCVNTLNPPLVCAAGSLLVPAGDGINFICSAISYPPPVVVPTCPAGESLTSDGATVTCVQLKLSTTSSSSSCAASSYSGPGGYTWWGCTATCPAGTRVTGGGESDSVSDNNGFYTMQSGNGWHCAYRIGACLGGAAKPCGLTCRATCSSIKVVP